SGSGEHSCDCPFGPPRIAKVWQHQRFRFGPNGQPPESSQLVALIERKLAEHGIAKVVPDDNTLADAYRRMHKRALIQDKIDELVEDLDEDEVEVPTELRRRVEEAIKLDPARSWDAIMRELAEQDRDEAP